MTTKTDQPTDQQPARGWPWAPRAIYEVGRTRRQRKEQFSQQIKALMIALAITAVAGFIFVYVNWTGAGSAKVVNCVNYPDYCVPFGGGQDGVMAQNEATGARELEGRSKGADGVVRGWDSALDMARLGDPSAPIHFVVITNYACSHCRDFHQGDLHKFIKNYVLTGQATVQLGFLPTTAGPVAEATNAAMAGMCAGEQGAFWEMTDELYRLAGGLGLDLTNVRNSAKDMKLDAEALIACVTSTQYSSFVDNHQVFAATYGASGTPAVFVSYGDSGQWQAVGRGYDNLRSLTESANATG